MDMFKFILVSCWGVFGPRESKATSICCPGFKVSEKILVHHAHLSGLNLSKIKLVLFDFPNIEHVAESNEFFHSRSSWFRGRKRSDT